jgi:hypothetical protein
MGERYEFTDVWTIPASIERAWRMVDDVASWLSTEGGPIGSKVFPSAQTWLLDDHGKTKIERIVAYMSPRASRACVRLVGA